MCGTTGKMKLTLERFTSDRDTTLGLLFVNSVWECFTLEDEFRVSKVRGKTRTPQGTYEVIFRKVLSPLTEKYRQKYPWFSWHLELQNVPNFGNVYIHIGNDHEDTDACILVGSSCDSKGSPDNVGSSTPTFQVLYGKVSAALKSGQKVEITIIDRD